jgi:histidyl-tRNA synthetase
MATMLRENGISADLYPTVDKLDKQLKYADKNGIPFVIIQGPEEQAKGVVKLKNMQTKVQEELLVKNVVKKLSSN